MWNPSNFGLLCRSLQLLPSHPTFIHSFIHFKVSWLCSMLVLFVEKELTNLVRSKWCRYRSEVVVEWPWDVM